MCDLGNVIRATGFEWLPKVQKIAQSGHTDQGQRPNFQNIFSVPNACRYGQIFSPVANLINILRG